VVGNGTRGDSTEIPNGLAIRIHGWPNKFSRSSWILDGENTISGLSGFVWIALVD
jgi:hypothetical protein